MGEAAWSCLSISPIPAGIHVGHFPEALRSCLWIPPWHRSKHVGRCVLVVSCCFSCGLPVVSCWSPCGPSGSAGSIPVVVVPWGLHVVSWVSHDLLLFSRGGRGRAGWSSWSFWLQRSSWCLISAWGIYAGIICAEEVLRICAHISEMYIQPYTYIHAYQQTYVFV